MFKTKYLIVLALGLGMSLAGCSRTYDCNSNEVLDTLQEAARDDAEKLKPYFGKLVGQEAYYERSLKESENITVTDVQTLAENHEYGRYRCEAKYVYEGHRVVVEYNVNALESSDSPFEIEYDRQAASNIMHYVYLKAQGLQ